MINTKILYDDLASIVAIGLLIESYYKGEGLNEHFDKSVRLDGASISGCNLYFSQASNNWCESRLNLKLNRYS